MVSVNWDTVPAERINDRITRKMVTGDKLMVVRWSFRAGADVPGHRHPNEQVAWMLSGTMRLRVGDRQLVCKPGDVVVIPGGVEHQATFPEDCDVIDIFAPPRADFLERSETYLARS